VTISGFTVLRQVVRLGYPFEASIRSLLPLVDELVVAVGDGDDGTWEAVQAIGDPRIKPFRSAWGVATPDGAILSDQTNLAFARCTGDWAVYLQADEVLHEDDLGLIREAMRRHLDRRTEGLLFQYHHFWRRYDLVVDDWLAFYPRAVRVVKVGVGVKSVGDACGFVRRHRGGTRGLLKADSGARIFHYGWCNPPALQVERVRNLEREVFGATGAPRRSADAVFAGGRVRRFEGTHPRPMAARVMAGASPNTAPPPPHTPAWARAWLGLLRSPLGNRGRARAFLPVPLTNTWWRAVDLWQRRSASRGRSTRVAAGPHG